MQLATARRVPGHPVGVLARRPGASGRATNGAIQMPGRRPAAAMRGGERVQVGREPLVGGQPVADGRLVAVVELEDVEGPVAGVGQVRRQVGLGHGAEVVVPGAPADLVRRAGPGRLRARRAPAPRPRAARCGRRRSTTRTRGAPATLAGRELRAAEERLDLERPAGRRAGRSQIVPSWRAPPSKPTSTRSGPSSASTVTSSERRSPGGAGRSSAWWVERTSAGTGSSEDGSASTPRVATPHGLQDW